MSALKDFISKNATPGNVGISALMNLDDLTSADHKLRGLLKTMRDMLLWPVMLKVSMASLFGMMGKGLKSLLHDTGSLDAALKKLSKIQGWERMFAPLVGGAKAARIEVAKLVNLSAGKQLKLDDVAQGALNLRKMTQGAYASTEALSSVSDAAKATGNSVTDATQAVGAFSESLRSGSSISSAADNLAEMNMISQSLADELKRMQESGAGVEAMMSKLTSGFSGSQGAADDAKNSVSGVQEAYEAAKTALQEAFGSPFVAADVENTKNWTAAMEAILPVVKSLSEFFNILIGGTSRLASWFTKNLAESSKFRTGIEWLVKGFAGLITVVSALSALSLAQWLLGASTGIAAVTARLLAMTGATGLAATAIRGLGLAIRVAMASTVILTLIAVLAQGIAMWMEWKEKSKEAADQARDTAQGMGQLNEAMDRQIDKITTITEKYEALAKAMGEADDANAAFHRAMDKGDFKEAAAQLEKLKQAGANEARIRGIQNSSLRMSDAGSEMMKTGAENDRRMNDQLWQEQYDSSSDQEKQRMLRERSQEFNLRARRAAGGVNAAFDYAQSGNQDATAAAAPLSSSTRLDYESRRAKSPAESSMFKAMADNARREESELGEAQRQAQGYGLQAMMMGINNRKNAAFENLGRQGQMAELLGRGSDAQRISGTKGVLDEYERLRPMVGGSEAIVRALSSFQNGLQIDAKNTLLNRDAATAASSMARVGGGGNVAAGGDALLDVTKMSYEVEKETLVILKQIYGKDAWSGLKN